MTFDELVAKVKKIVNRGDLYDADIPLYVRDAIREEENNYSYSYMERYVSFTLNQGNLDPDRGVTVPKRLKSVNFMRVETEDGKLLPITGIHPTLIRTIHSDGTLPSYYWLDSDQYFWFNSTPGPKDAWKIYLSYNQFSDPNTTQPKLLEVAPLLVLSLTIIAMAPELRNPGLLQLYTPMRDESRRKLLGMELEREYSNLDNTIQMEV